MASVGNVILMDGSSCFPGDYFGFDTTQPTSRSGGKADAINMIKARYNDPNLKVIMVGDGATDLEASPPATHFIGKQRLMANKSRTVKLIEDFLAGYGGNIVRQEVHNRSTYYATDFQELMGQID